MGRGIIEVFEGCLRSDQLCLIKDVFRSSAVANNDDNCVRILQARLLHDVWSASMSATYMIDGTYIVIVSRISEGIIQLPACKQLSRVLVGTLIYELDRPCRRVLWWKPKWKDSLQPIPCFSGQCIAKGPTPVCIVLDKELDEAYSKHIHIHIISYIIYNVGNITGAYRPASRYFTAAVMHLTRHDGPHDGSKPQAGIFRLLHRAAEAYPLLQPKLRWSHLGSRWCLAVESDPYRRCQTPIRDSSPEGGQSLPCEYSVPLIPLLLPQY